MSEPDRTKLPIRRPPFGGVANKTLAGSEPDWNLIGHVEPPAGAPNVLVVLIDDAGFGNPATFGGPVATPALDQPLCSPGGTAIPSASARSVSSRAGSPGTRLLSRGIARRCLASCGITGTAPRRSASGT